MCRCSREVRTRGRDGASGGQQAEQRGPRTLQNDPPAPLVWNMTRHLLQKTRWSLACPPCRQGTGPRPQVRDSRPRVQVLYLENATL